MLYNTYYFYSFLLIISYFNLYSIKFYLNWFNLWFNLLRLYFYIEKKKIKSNIKIQIKSNFDKLNKCLFIDRIQFKFEKS